MNGCTGLFRRRRALEVALDAVLRTAGYALDHRHSRVADRLALQVLAIEPAHAPALVLRARIAATHGSIIEAVASLRRALQIEPDRAAWHHELGVLSRCAGRYADAAASLRTAIRLRPYRADSMVELAMSLSAMGVCEDAEYWAARSLQIEPKNKTARELLEHLTAMEADAA